MGYIYVLENKQSKCEKASITIILKKFFNVISLQPIKFSNDKEKKKRKKQKTLIFIQSHL